MIKNLILKILYRNNRIKYFQKKGVQFGDNCRLIGENKFGSEPYLIKMGNHVSMTNVTFITHDGGVWVFREKHPDIDVIKPIIIGDNVFIGSECIIMPGVVIGSNVVIGARSLVNKNIPSNSVFAGQPARFIKTLDEYWEGVKGNISPIKKLSNNEKKKYLLKKFQIS